MNENTIADEMGENWTKSRIIFDIENNTFYCQKINKNNQILTNDCIEILKDFGAVFKNRIGNVDNKNKEYAIISIENP